MTPVRVLVVDDSVVIRRLVSETLGRDPRVEVVGTASNGRLALARVEQLAPDAVTMDVEMPEMNGIEAVRALRSAGHRMPIIMFSTLTERGAAATLDALSAGATDYVAKPTGGLSVTDSLQRVAEELIPKLLALTGAMTRRSTAAAHPWLNGPAQALSDVGNVQVAVPLLLAAVVCAGLRGRAGGRPLWWLPPLAAVAAMAADAHDDFKKQVDDASKDWSDQAKQSFNARAGMYQQALEGTKSQHESIDTVLKVTAGVLGALGVASAAIGTLMALQAAAVISVSWLPGVDAGVFAEANGVGAAMNAALRAMVTGFLKLVLNVKNILSLFKNVMAKRLVQFAALGNLTGGAVLGGQMFNKPWQGVSQTA